LSDAPQAQPANEDALVAAVAICNGLTVVTRKIAEFAGLDAPTLDPFAVTR
jgi:predicted nucleic acid-binding protein